MKKNILFIFMFFMFNLLTFSQCPKIGHVNTSDILSNLPEIKIAQEKFSLLEQKHQIELQKLANKLQKKVQECEKISSKKKSICLKEVNNLQKKVESYHRIASESLEKEQNNILSPIYNKIEKIIQEVTKNKNLEYILDSSPGKGILMAKGIDLTEEIKNKLKN